MELTLTGGEVWWAAPAPTVGREQSGRRPVVIVSGEEYNRTVTTLALAVPVTSRDRGWPNHVALEGRSGLDLPLWGMTEQVRAVSRERLTRPIGLVTPGCLDEIRWWLRAYLTD